MKCGAKGMFAPPFLLLLNQGSIPSEEPLG